MSGDDLIEACRDQDYTQVVRLVESGVDLNYMNYSGETPLRAACKGDDRNIIEFLVANGAIVEQYEFKITTPLMVACSKRDSRLVAFLLSHGADISKIDASGDKPIHYARDIEVMKILIASGADPEAKRLDGMRPLHIACLGNFPDLLRFLIEEIGVDRNALDNNGKNAYDYTRSFYNPWEVIAELR